MLARRLSTTFLTLLAAVLTTAGLGLVWAGPAQAHSELISSSPAEGEQAEARPEMVTLEFNEDIQDIGNQIVVTAPDGTDVVDGDPVVDGPVVTQALAAADDPAAAAGQYTVTWRVVSSDGHPISGAFTFEVLAAAESESATEDPAQEDTTEEASSEATLEASSEVAPSSAEAEDDDATGSGAAAPIVIGLLVLALVAIAILVIRRRRAR